MGVLKVLGKLFSIWLCFIGILAVAVLVVVAIAMIIRFRLLFAVALVFFGLAYLFTKTAGIEVKTKTPRYRKIITSTGEKVYVRMEDDDLRSGTVLS
jgi:hypothetical protein